MANRNSTSLTIPGNPLGSVLREVAREARRSTRDPNAVQYATDEDFAALQAQVNTLQNQILALQGTVPIGQGIVTTNVSGVATFTYQAPNPFPLPASPIIQATALVDDNAAVTVNSTGQTSCVVAVRRPATGVAYAGVRVFVTVYASALVP